jgi:hypothetical protein
MMGIGLVRVSKAHFCRFGKSYPPERSVATVSKHCVLRTLISSSFSTFLYF